MRDRAGWGKTGQEGKHPSTHQRAPWGLRPLHAPSPHALDVTVNKLLRIVPGFVYTQPCPVCFDEVVADERGACALACGHEVHRDCYDQLIQHDHRSCPLCRETLPPLSIGSVQL